VWSVRAGQVGRTLTEGQFASTPWYAYAAAAAGLAIIGKVVGDVAQKAIKDYEQASSDSEDSSL
jgi:hypothetical protein